MKHEDLYWEDVLEISTKTDIIWVIIASEFHTSIGPRLRCIPPCVIHARRCEWSQVWHRSFVVGVHRVVRLNMSSTSQLWISEQTKVLGMMGFETLPRKDEWSKWLTPCILRIQKEGRYWRYMIDTWYITHSEATFETTCTAYVEYIYTHLSIGYKHICYIPHIYIYTLLNLQTHTQSLAGPLQRVFFWRVIAWRWRRLGNGGCIYWGSFNRWFCIHIRWWISNIIYIYMYVYWFQEFLIPVSYRWVDGPCI